MAASLTNHSPREGPPDQSQSAKGPFWPITARERTSWPITARERASWPITARERTLLTNHSSGKALMTNHSQGKALLTNHSQGKALLTNHSPDKNLPTNPSQGRAISIMCSLAITIEEREWGQLSLHPFGFYVSNSCQVGKWDHPDSVHS